MSRPSQQSSAIPICECKSVPCVGFSQSHAIRYMNIFDRWWLKRQQATTDDDNDDEDEIEAERHLFEGLEENCSPQLAHMYRQLYGLKNNVTIDATTCNWDKVLRRVNDVSDVKLASKHVMKEFKSFSIRRATSSDQYDLTCQPADSDVEAPAAEHNSISHVNFRASVDDAIEEHDVENSHHKFIRRKKTPSSKSSSTKRTHKTINPVTEQNQTDDQYSVTDSRVSGDDSNDIHSTKCKSSNLANGASPSQAPNQDRLNQRRNTTIDDVLEGDPVFAQQLLESEEENDATLRMSLQPALVDDDEVTTSDHIETNKLSRQNSIAVPETAVHFGSPPPVPHKAATVRYASPASKGIPSRRYQRHNLPRIQTDDTVDSSEFVDVNLGRVVKTESGEMLTNPKIADHAALDADFSQALGEETESNHAVKFLTF